MSDVDVIRPIAYIRTDFKEKFGIPRQSGRAPSLTGRVVFLPEYRNPDALRGIDGFSHLWLVFDFSEAHRAEWSPTVRPPRLGGNQRMGVFATRSPFRPNHIGLSCVRLIGVEKTAADGDVLAVAGADLLDGTPIYDVKPYIPYADCHPEATGGYTDAVGDRHLEVVFPDEWLALIPADKREALTECLAQDPRPSYQEDTDRVYSMKFADADVHFTVNDGVATVVKVDKLR